MNRYSRIPIIKKDNDPKLRYINIKYPLITDKATRLLESNKYTFIIDPKANKFTIKKVIEYVFNVTVVKVNTLNIPNKKKTVGRYSGYKSQYKKAIICYLIKKIPCLLL